MAVERVLITVKTYPTLSKTYVELVCTAGLREDGSWVRIYPIPFRIMDDIKKYRKWEWVEVDLTKNANDPRPESFRPDMWNFECTGHLIDPKRWGKRMQMIEKDGIFHDLQELIDCNKQTGKSLATFKPEKILDFYWEKTSEQWDPEKLAHAQHLLDQDDLFEKNPSFKIVDKLPYKFFYRFLDSKGKESRPQIIDWEVGAAYWNFLRTYKDEATALQKIKEKYLTSFSEKNLHFFLGTMRTYDRWSLNPFVIIGVAPFPNDLQPELI